MAFMNNPTRHKLNEADYFLSMMKKTFYGNSDIFQFNLNAFLTASRSITFYMQKQYKKCSGFSEWYCHKQIELSNDQELKFLLKARDDVIHKEPVGTTAEFECFSPGAFITDINNEEEILNKLEQIDKRETKINIIRRFFAQDDETEIVEFCEKQLNKLTKLVDECETHFPQQE